MNNRWPFAAACLVAVLPLLLATPHAFGAGMSDAPIVFKSAVEAENTTLGARLIAAIGIGACVLAATMWMVLLRMRAKRAVPGGGPAIKLIEARRLGSNAVLHVVEFGGARYLIAACGEGSVNCIATVETAAANQMEMP